MVCITRDFQTSFLNPQTTSSKFIAEEARFRSVQKGARALAEHVSNVVDAVRARHAAELLIAEALEDIFPWALEAPKVKEVTLDTCNRLLQQFVSRTACRKGSGRSGGFGRCRWMSKGSEWEGEKGTGGHRQKKRALMNE